MARRGSSDDPGTADTLSALEPGPIDAPVQVVFSEPRCGPAEPANRRFRTIVVDPAAAIVSDAGIPAPDIEMLCTGRPERVFSIPPTAESKLLLRDALPLTGPPDRPGGGCRPDLP